MPSSAAQVRVRCLASEQTSHNGRATAMRVNANIVIPGLIAGVIYFVIAFATGASAVTSIVGGIVVAAIAIAIGLIFRAAFKRTRHTKGDP